MYDLCVLPRRPRHAAITSFFSLLTFTAVAGAETPLLTARQALNQLMKQTLPACPNALQSVKGKRDDVTFLLRKFQEAGWGSIGPEYVLSLNDLAEGLRQAAEGPRTEAGCEKVRLILSDLHAKRRDCEILGHSRMDVPVEISTIREKQAIQGLEVYARWIPAGDHFDTQPKRLKDFSSPARGTVPIPGEFEIFARDPSTGESTEPERLSIGGASVFRWKMQVRFHGKAPVSK